MQEVCTRLLSRGCTITFRPDLERGCYAICVEESINDEKAVVDRSVSCKLAWLVHDVFRKCLEEIEKQLLLHKLQFQASLDENGQKIP